MLVSQGSPVFPQSNLVYSMAGNRAGRKELRGREEEKRGWGGGGGKAEEITDIFLKRNLFIN